MLDFLTRNYDKLLHVSITFMLTVYLALLVPFYTALIIVLVLQLGKTMLNYYVNLFYMPLGDWVANIIGFVLAIVYLQVS